MSIEKMGSGSPEKEPAKNGQEYFKEQEGTQYTVQNETDNTVEIDVRPGLLGKVIAAGVATEKGKTVSFELQGKQLTIKPEEASSILEKSIDDLLDGK
ncbi:MAG: hypothetical protein U9N04_02280 [Patescibacteria group bacterium]|nr:hypothetical protein [Patescibacteria group bacterium]